MFLRSVVAVTFDPPLQIIWRPFPVDLDLPKVKAELLASRFKQWNLLQSGVNICIFRTRQQSLAQIFSIKGGLVYYTDADGTLKELGYSHRSEEWRMFIDSSKLSLNVVLLHNINMLPSIRVWYTAHMNETYEMTQLLQCIKLRTVNGTVMQDMNITLKRTGQKEALWKQVQ